MNEYRFRTSLGSGEDISLCLITLKVKALLSTHFKKDEKKRERTAESTSERERERARRWSSEERERWFRENPVNNRNKMLFSHTAVMF